MVIHVGRRDYVPEIRFPTNSDDATISNTNVNDTVLYVVRWLCFSMRAFPFWQIPFVLQEMRDLGFELLNNLVSRHFWFSIVVWAGLP